MSIKVNKITFAQLENMPLPDTITMDYLRPFSDPVDIDITLEYGAEKKDHTLYLRPEDLSGFSKWVAKVAFGK